MNKTFRSGALGALMDEYERASGDLIRILDGMTDAEYELLRDTQTQDEDCRSIQTIMSHVVRSGYGYANRMRDTFSLPFQERQPRILSRNESLNQLREMLVYTADTLDGRWHLSNEEIIALQIRSPWGPENLEQVLEHAIVHILRHRRQIERFLTEKQFQKTSD
jgi:uncharacterized damage-inducible protein DinB